jgi:hypothetical protein
MKKYIVEALKWALSKFEDKTAEIVAWPFPVPEVKHKPQVKKATTRIVVKKATPVAKKATKKVK